MRAGLATLPRCRAERAGENSGDNVHPRRQVWFTDGFKSNRRTPYFRPRLSNGPGPPQTTCPLAGFAMGVISAGRLIANTEMSFP